MSTSPSTVVRAHHALLENVGARNIPTVSDASPIGEWLTETR